MTTTPWEEARREAIVNANAQYVSLQLIRDNPERSMGEALNLALTTLSRHGWRLVPAEVTEKMRTEGYWARREERGAVRIYEAMTEVGDVLQAKA